MKHSRLIHATALLVYVVPTVAPTYAAQADAPAARVAAQFAGPTLPSDATKLSLAEPAQPAPIAGDLTHLVFTATSNLAVDVVSPEPNAYGGVAARVEVATVTGAGVEVRVGDAVVPFTHIGKRVVTRDGKTQFTYFGVPLEPGPNTIRVTALGAGGMRGFSKTTTIFGAGRATALHVTVQGRPVADGKTPLLLHVRGIDQWNNPARPGAIAHVTIVGGDAHFVGARGSNGANPVLSASLHDAAGGGVPTPAVAGTSPVREPLSVAGAALNAPGGAIDVTQSTAVAPNPFATPFGGPSAAPGYDSATAGAPDDRGNVPVAAGENYRATGDLTSQTQSIDVPIGGDSLVPIVPGLRSGEVQIRVTDGDLTTDERFYLAPYVRPPLVLGLLTLGAGQVPGIPGEVDTATNAADSRRARGALFATGAIGASTLATLAYNTADTLDENTTNGAFIDDPANRPYQLYGDASDHRVDALSRDHLYARVDSGRSSVLWGDFVAQTGGSDGIGGFNLLVHGLQGTAAGANVRVTGFEARNDIAYSRQIFSPTGLATTSTLLHGDIVVGSDVITLIALDRRTGGVVSQTPLTRNVDYTLDNVTGQLRFINIPLPYDASFDPQQLVITYEYGGVATNAETSGGRAEYAFGTNKSVKVGVGYVNDSYGTGNYSLFSQDVGGILPGGLWSLGHATSKGSLGVTGDVFNESVGNGGDAYRLALTAGGGPNHVTAGFDMTTAGYDNPFNGISTPGLMEYRLAYTRRLDTQNSQLTLSYDHERNSTFGSANTDSNASLHVDKNFGKRFTLKGGVDFRSATSTAAATQLLAAPLGPDQPSPVINAVTAATLGNSSTTQGELGFMYRPVDPLRLSISRLANLGGGGDLAQPQQTSAEISYDFKNKGRAFVRQLWSSSPQQSFAASTASLTSQTQATRSTAFGFERAVGTNTTVDSEYVVDNGANGSDVYASLGVKERFSFGKNVKGDAAFQHANAIGAGLGGFNLYDLQLAYGIPSGVKVTGSYQLRTGSGAGSTLALGAIGAVSPSLSLFGSLQNSNTVGILSDADSVGVAYRPYFDDRSVTLVAFNNIGGNNSVLGSKTETISAEELYRPSWHLELAGRYAYKIDGDTYYSAHSELFGLRATQRVGNRFDIGGETRYLAAKNVPGASFTAFAMEGGYRLGDQMRLGFGYNFTGAPDPALAAAPTRRGIYATATSTVDNIFGWGKNH